MEILSFDERLDLNSDLRQILPSATIHQDCDLTIEITSGILHSRDEVKRFYQKASAFAKRRGWPLTGDGFTSGGGHIHVSGDWPRGKTRWIRNDCINRPYLPWIFNEPDDDNSANHPLTHYDPHYDKHVALRVIGSRHVEIRFFEAPHNLKEQMLHFDFADRWITSIGPTKQKVRAKRKRRPCHCIFPCQPRRCYNGEKYMDFSPWPIDRSIAEFKELLEQLNLSYKDYKVFVDRNLALKYEWGLT